MANPKPLNLEEINKADIISQAIVNSFAKCEWQESMPLGAIHLEALKLFENEVKQRIKSACEFYLKYFDKPYKLKEDYPEIADEVDEIIRETIEMTPEEDGWSHYNKWLFKLTFKAVLGDRNEI